MERTENTVGSVKVIADELGNLPMALVQAGSYMLQSECSCEEYLDRLRQRRAEMMYIPAGDRLQRSAYHAFDLSFQRLQPFVQRFLHVIGCVHYADFPMKAIAIAAEAEFEFDQFLLVEHDATFKESVDILKSIFCPEGIWKEYILDNMVTELKTYSLASFTRTPRSLLLRIHPLMHQWTLVHLTPQKQASYRLAASRLLACSYNEETLQQFLMPQVDALIPQLPDSPIAIYDKVTFGHVLQKMGRDKDSKAILEPIYNAIVQRYGEQDFRVATMALELAAASTNDLEKTERLEMQAIDIRERVLGSEHVETLLAKAELSGTYQLQGRLGDAELLHLEVLERIKKTLGPTHDEVVRLMHWLGELYHSQSRYSEAESLQEDILKIRKERLGDTHADTLWAMHNLALNYHSQGRHTEAEPIQKYVLKIRKEQLGDAHADTVLAMHNLASTYYSQGRHLDAERLELHVLKVRKEQLGDTHVDTLSAMHDLASTYYWQGRHSDAEPLHQHVLKIQKAQLDDTHADTLLTMHNMALNYHSQGRHSDAESLQQHVLKARKEQLGDIHVDTLLAMHNLASTYYSQGRYSDSRLLEEKVLQEQRNLQGEHHLDTAVSMDHLGWTYYRLGMIVEAKELATQAERVRRNILGVDHPDYKITAELLRCVDEALANQNLFT
jgi:tetratricopeptide (TPR) repeat protein